MGDVTTHEMSRRSDLVLYCDRLDKEGLGRFWRDTPQAHKHQRVMIWNEEFAQAQPCPVDDCNGVIRLRLGVSEKKMAPTGPMPSKPPRKKKKKE